MEKKTLDDIMDMASTLLDNKKYNLKDQAALQVLHDEAKRASYYANQGYTLEGCLDVLAEAHKSIVSLSRIWLARIHAGELDYDYRTCTLGPELFKKGFVQDDGTLIKFGWPGGYPAHYLDSENSSLCGSCANDLSLRSWKIVDGEIYEDDFPLYCDQCSKNIAGDEDEEQE